MTANAICWEPSGAARNGSQMAAFIRGRVAEGVALPDTADSTAFAALHAWSILDRAAFWDAIRGLAIRHASQDADTVVLRGDTMAPQALGGARWFPGLRFNFTAEALAGDPEADALVAWDERGPGPRWSRARLKREVALVSAGLRSLGIRPGDRVAGWVPNIPESIVAMLASAAIGAVWTSCSPDFGTGGIVDRFGQTEPKVLFFADGYQYNGRCHDCVTRAEELAERLPTVERFVMIPYLGDGSLPDDARFTTWQQLSQEEVTELEFEQLPFDHPLLILYSSGTTGLPKCLVHGAGGTLLQHVKEHRLHTDIRPGERFFYFTTCGWMMWNWLVSGLATGAVLVLYDGAPMPAAEPELLWRLADAERVNVFGTSAKFLALAEKSGHRPRGPMRPQSALRVVLSTGSPLGAESFDWLGAVLPGVQVSSISGGTDIVSCFVLGNPLQPVARGEIQGPGLGMAVRILGPDGEPQADGEAGELVCTEPFPAMPVEFWGDPSGARYRAAYFEPWPGVWRHGDWASHTARGGYVIAGRSDTTLNPGGVRVGTAEIYRAVESIEEVLEGLVIGQRIPGSGEGDVRIVLFVRLRQPGSLDADLVARIKRVVRERSSPHHVPRVILEVADLPRTRSGKLSELAVRDVVEGRSVANRAALANPECLGSFSDRPELALE